MGSTDSTGSMAPRFAEYFSREVAEKAAHTLSNGSEIEFQIDSQVSNSSLETFTFVREGGKNRIVSGAAKDPQILFRLSAIAAESILSDPAQDIGSIGIGIFKLVISKDPAKKVEVKFKAGFLGLFTRGYFGVLSSGGAAFASFLAARGLGGIGAIKAAFKKMKSDQ